MQFTDDELKKLLKYIRNAKDQSTELYEAMIDIETYGEVDHDGMPVVNSEELKEDIVDMEKLIVKIEKHFSGNRQGKSGNYK
ncbi:MAG TPA: hypothetical protein VLM88_12685, partial [Proteiniclasticum sp.]|nr:hypothetical protein [Proteiniclasticum sp.]